MKLKQWWKFVAMYELRRQREKLIIWVAWLVPKYVAYWVFIRMAASFGTNPDDITASDILNKHADWYKL